jgi:hypothetical protein
MGTPLMVSKEFVGTPLVILEVFSTTFGGFNGNSSYVNRRNFDELFWYKSEMFPSYPPV